MTMSKGTPECMKKKKKCKIYILQNFIVQKCVVSALPSTPCLCDMSDASNVTKNNFIFF